MPFVFAAGPIFNFILAFFGAMIIIGIIGYDPPVITQVKEGTPEEACALPIFRIITESQHITFFRCRMIGQSFFFPISFYSNCNRFIFQPFQCQIRIELSSQINLLPIKGSDQIAFFQPCSFFRCSCMMRGEDGEDNAEGTFNSKSVWRRFSVIAAGPILNLFLHFSVQ